MRKPKAPAGFVAVDSEEARKIDGGKWVNTASLDRDVWMFGHVPMYAVRDSPAHCRYHVQLPPAVEWEEVWGWGHDNLGPHLVRNGVWFRWCDLGDTSMDTIVRALNEMEGRDGR